MDNYYLFLLFQLLWLIGEMMKTNMANLEGPIHIILRQIAGTYPGRFTKFIITVL